MVVVIEPFLGKAVTRWRRIAFRLSTLCGLGPTLFPWLIMNHLPPASTPKDADSTPAMGRIGAMRRQFTGQGWVQKERKWIKEGAVATSLTRRIDGSSEAACGSEESRDSRVRNPSGGRLHAREARRGDSHPLPAPTRVPSARALATSRKSVANPKP